MLCQAKRSLRSFDPFDTHSVPFATAALPGPPIVARSTTRFVSLSILTRWRLVSIHSCPLQKTGAAASPLGSIVAGDFHPSCIYLPDLYWRNRIYAAAREPEHGSGGCEVVATGAVDGEGA
jgi:hypothetical protein